MVTAMGPLPLFWYIYSPRARQGRKRSGSEGFNVALYSDGSLVYSKYDENFDPQEQSCFQLPMEVTDTFLMILQSETWWLRTLPLHIRSQQPIPEYSCRFGFAGHPLFTCDEMLKMTMLSDVDRNGVYARRLHVMMEFITEMLYGYGMLLQLDSFTWDWRRIQPLPQDQANARMLALNNQQQELEQMTAAQ
ncbi:MAG: hypothetical protein IJE07_12745 [Clostridia bacterium]|nr:hypothetical protein [Clostridia bacterium]